QADRPRGNRPGGTAQRHAPRSGNRPAEVTTRVKNWIVRTLLRLYPAAWRQEYGSELMDVLLARPLTAGVVGDVLQNGLRQRVRGADPSTLVGLAMLLVVLNGFVWNIVAPAPYSNESSILLQNLL